jgi:hypothetical protein
LGEPRGCSQVDAGQRETPEAREHFCGEQSAPDAANQLGERFVVRLDVRDLQTRAREADRILLDGPRIRQAGDPG